MFLPYSIIMPTPNKFQMLEIHAKICDKEDSNTGPLDQEPSVLTSIPPTIEVSVYTKRENSVR